MFSQEIFRLFLLVKITVSNFPRKREIQIQRENKSEHEFSTAQLIYAYKEGITMRTCTQKAVQYDFATNLELNRTSTKLII